MIKEILGKLRPLYLTLLYYETSASQLDDPIDYAFMSEEQTSLLTSLNLMTCWKSQLRERIPKIIDSDITKGIYPAKIFQRCFEDALDENLAHMLSEDLLPVNDGESPPQAVEQRYEYLPHRRFQPIQ